MQVTYTDLLGCKFAPKGRTKENGFDCYGLAIEVLKRNGIYLKDVFYDFDKKEEQAEEIKTKLNISKIDKIQKLCIINIKVHGNPVHIAVYLGDGLIIHSVYNKGVIIEPLHLYQNRIEGYYKVTNFSLQNTIK